jgi:hypothetical protein
MKKQLRKARRQYVALVALGALVFAAYGTFGPKPTQSPAITFQASQK